MHENAIPHPSPPKSAVGHTAFRRDVTSVRSFVTFVTRVKQHTYDKMYGLTFVEIRP